MDPAFGLSTSLEPDGHEVEVAETSLTVPPWEIARDYEPLPGTLAGLHLVAFATLMLGRLVTLLTSS